MLGADTARVGDIFNLVAHITSSVPQTQPLTVTIGHVCPLVTLHSDATQVRSSLILSFSFFSALPDARYGLGDPRVYL